MLAMKAQRSYLCAPLWLLAARILFAVSAAWYAPASAPAFAQDSIAIPAEALPDESELQRVLQRGYELEAEQRWSEALGHYEEAVREFPQRPDLQERLTRARIHYDLARRYEDPTYTSWIAALSESESLEVYTEVLQKIETHHVQQPDWYTLAERGVNNLTLALTRTSFRQTNAIAASEATIRTFSDQLHSRLQVTTVQSRRDVQEVARAVARLAYDQLGLRPSATVLEFTCGATCTLDPYSCFLTSGQLEDVFSQIEGNFIGLGIELKADQHSLLIVDVIPGGPAHDAGLHSGDRIVQVDGASLTDITTDEAADMLKGPDGSQVAIKLKDAQGLLRDVRLVRRQIDVPSVEDASIIDSQYGIAYLRVTGFQKTTARDFDAALWDLHRQGMRSLIIDLRGNPGGLLTAAVDVADKFVTSGRIVSTRGRNTHEDFDYTAHSAGTWRVPLTVLIDGDTASASEILAGAIRDHRRGTVVGQRSYGKGSVQGIFSLHTSQAGVRLTTAKFYSPDGHEISQRGVYPDLVVRTANKPLTAGGTPSPGAEDPILNAGLQVARNNLLSQRGS
jgi:carboxyl-terminal processing protease